MVFQGIVVSKLLHTRRVIARHDGEHVASPKFNQEAAVYFTFDGGVEFVLKNLSEDGNKLQMFGSFLAHGVQVTPAGYTLQQQDLGLERHLTISQQVSHFLHVLGGELPSGWSSCKTSIGTSEVFGLSTSSGHLSGDASVCFLVVYWFLDSSALSFPPRPPAAVLL